MKKNYKTVKSKVIEKRHKLTFAITFPWHFFFGFYVFGSSKNWVTNMIIVAKATLGIKQ